MAERRRVLIQRQDNGPGVRELFYVQPGNRSARWIWFRNGEVPPFDGKCAYFEIERGKDGWFVVGLVP